MMDYNSSMLLLSSLVKGTSLLELTKAIVRLEWLQM